MRERIRNSVGTGSLRRYAMFVLLASCVFALTLLWATRTENARAAVEPTTSTSVDDAGDSVATEFAVSADLPVDASDGTADFGKLHDPKRIPQSQRVFDKFAWQAFVALNWAAQEDGSPDPAIKTAEDDARENYRRPRVWETFAETNVLFKANGVKPEEWPKGQLPSWSPGVPMKGDEVVWMTSKIHNRNTRSHTSLADENVQAFTGPLVDQNGKWVRYQVRVNRTEYNYIRENGLFSLEGQAAYLNAGNVIDFPVDGATVAGEPMKYGSIEVKLSWKQLAEPKDAGAIAGHASDEEYLRNVGLARVMVPDASGTPQLDHFTVIDPDAYGKQFRWSSDPGRYLYRYVRVIHNGGATDSSGVPVPDPLPVPLGIVGMHISMRTRSSPQWIWATFEHVDNVAVNDLQKVRIPGVDNPVPLRPSFNNPDRPADAVNIQPETNIRRDSDTGRFTDWDESKTTKPVQVLRVLATPLATAEMNQIAQKRLRAAQSVLQFYELVGVQWPVQPEVPNFPSGQGSAPESVVFKVPGHVVPTFVANTTMETYFQGGNQPAGPQERDNRPPKAGDDLTMVFATESCVGCHFSAGACRGFKLDTSKVVFDKKVGGYVYPFELKDGRKKPIFGIDGHGGKTGNANFSWLLQMKAQSTGEGATPGEFEKKVAEAVDAAKQPSAPASINDPGSDPEQIPRLKK